MATGKGACTLAGKGFHSLRTFIPLSISLLTDGPTPFWLILLDNSPLILPACAPVGGPGRGKVARRRLVLHLEMGMWLSF